MDKEHQDCWICDKWTYSLVFFNPARLARKNQWEKVSKLKEFLIRKMVMYNGAEVADDFFSDEDPFTP